MNDRREYPFESLLTGLVEALGAARSAMQDQYRCHLQAFVRDGNRSIGPERAAVSVANLRAFRQMRIRDLSIEFDCWLHSCRKTSTVRLVLQRPARWRRQRVYRVLIEMLDEPQAQGRVSIDGRLFKYFPADSMRKP